MPRVECRHRVRSCLPHPWRCRQAAASSASSHKNTRYAPGSSPGSTTRNPSRTPGLQNSSVRRRCRKVGRLDGAVGTDGSLSVVAHLFLLCLWFVVWSSERTSVPAAGGCSPADAVGTRCPYRRGTRRMLAAPPRRPRETERAHAERAASLPAASYACVQVRTCPRRDSLHGKGGSCAARPASPVTAWRPGLRPPSSWGYRPQAGEGVESAPLAPLRGHVVAKREYVPPG